MYNEGTKAFTAGEALEARRRVKLESGTVTTPPEIVYADSDEEHIGITEYSAEDGGIVAVKLRNVSGSFEIECLVGTAIAVGTGLYGAADGIVTDTDPGTGTIRFTALEAGADNAVIECLPV